MFRTLALVLQGSGARASVGLAVGREACPGYGGRPWAQFDLVRLAAGVTS